MAALAPLSGSQSLADLWSLSSSSSCLRHFLCPSQASSPARALLPGLLCECVFVSESTIECKLNTRLIAHLPKSNPKEQQLQLQHQQQQQREEAIYASAKAAESKAKLPKLYSSSPRRTQSVPSIVNGGRSFALVAARIRHKLCPHGRLLYLESRRHERG